MTENDLDREITEIERYAIGKWLVNGDALVCARCGGVYIPSRSSDDRLCAMCVPLRNLAVGDKSPQYAKCEYCNGDIGGRRADARFCSDSCKTMYCRRKGRGDTRTVRDSAIRAERGQDIGPPVIRKQSTLEEAST